MKVLLRSLLVIVTAAALTVTALALANHFGARLTTPVAATPGTPPAPEAEPAAPGTGEAPDGVWALPPEYGVNEQDLARNDGWVTDALAASRDQGGPVVIIDKAAYLLYFVQAGEVTHSYPVELGFDPVSDKRMEGDGTTPEGPYRVTEKRDIGQTSYYRGWMLSYPEERDHAEFAAGQADGSIPAEATVGSAIMLHGSGSGEAGNGAGRNWTLGCIALSNEQVDALFPHIDVGDPVVIVRYTSVPLGPAG